MHILECNAKAQPQLQPITSIDTSVGKVEQWRYSAMGTNLRNDAAFKSREFCFLVQQNSPEIFKIRDFTQILI